MARGLKPKGCSIEVPAGGGRDGFYSTDEVPPEDWLVWSGLVTSCHMAGCERACGRAECTSKPIHDANMGMALSKAGTLSGSRIRTQKQVIVVSESIH